MKLINYLALATVGSAVLAMPNADGVTQFRRLRVSAAGACQSALPVYDVSIRKRPLAVQNEGDAPAFVTCALYTAGVQDGSSNPISVYVYVSTNDGATDTVNCTGVLGTKFAATYVVHNAIAQDSPGAMIWSSSDFGGVSEFPSGNFSISCLLNPGVAIDQLLVVYREDIGN